MATYSTPPATRIDYARDGTLVGYWLDPGVGVFGTGSDRLSVVEFTQAQKDLLNQESFGTATLISDGDNEVSYLVFVFPELRSLFGLYVNRDAGSGNASSPTPVTVYTSVDTTNGVDGTWVSRGTYPLDSSSSGVLSGGTAADSYRTLVQSVSYLSVRGVRIKSLGGIGGAFGTATQYRRVHFYGVSVLSAGRLRMWHPTLDQEISSALLDWGDVPRSSSADMQFRVKNTSSTQTAASVVLQFVASAVDSTPGTGYQHYLSEDGLSYRGYLVIPSVGPGQTTSVMYVRRVMPSNAATDKPYVTKLSMSGTWV
jgi:hypothetical protein